jgi:hypothetical protein
LNPFYATYRVSIVILPFLFFVGIFAYLDKGNLNFAAIELNPHLGLNAGKHAADTGAAARRAVGSQD